MTNIYPIYLDSNICRTPHVVRKYGPYYGFALDLLVYVAKHSHDPNYRNNLGEFHQNKSIQLLANDFYNEFGHSKSHLLHKPTPAAIQRIFGDAKEDIADHGKTVLEAALYAMGARNLSFKYGYDIADRNRGVARRTDFLQLFSSIEVKRGRNTLSQIQFSIAREWIWNNHMRPQAINLERYCAIRTPGTENEPRGRNWPVGRMLYLRLLYTWGSANAEKHNLAQVSETFHALAIVAGVDSRTNYKHMANDLRQWCQQVCELGGLPFTVEITPSSRGPVLLQNGVNKNRSPYTVTLLRKAYQGSLKLQA